MNELNLISEEVEEAVLQVLQEHYDERTRHLTGEEPVELLTRELESIVDDLMKLALATIPVKLNMALHEFLNRAEFVSSYKEMLDNICDMEEENQAYRNACEAKSFYDVAKKNYDFAAEKLATVQSQNLTKYNAISDMISDTSSAYVTTMQLFDAHSNLDKSEGATFDEDNADDDTGADS